MECPNCNMIVEEDDHERVGYDSWHCVECGRQWDDSGVHEWGQPVCRKCGEVLKGEPAVNDEPSLGGCCL